jgi:hypothetical protein
MLSNWASRFIPDVLKIGPALLESNHNSLLNQVRPMKGLSPKIDLGVDDCFLLEVVGSARGVGSISSCSSSSSACKSAIFASLSSISIRSLGEASKPYRACCSF